MTDAPYNNREIYEDLKKQNTIAVGLWITVVILFVFLNIIGIGELTGAYSVFPHV